MAKASKKYSVADIRLAIEAAGASPAAIARELGCSRSAVYSYLKIPELKARYEAIKGGQVEAKPQFPKEAFEKAIQESHGVKAAVMSAVGCSRQTVDNAFERWPDLKVQLDVARASLVSKATSKLVEDIDDKESKSHFQAYMFVLKTFGKDEGFVERSEVTGADGAGLLDIPPDLAQQVKDLGLDLREVLRALVAMPPPPGG